MSYDKRAACNEMELSSIRTLKAYIEELESELEFWQAKAEGLTGIRYDKVVVQGGIPLNGTETLQKLLAIEKAIGTTLEQLRGKMSVYAAHTAMLPLESAYLLRLRYISGLNFEQIGKKIGYSARQSLRLVKRAEREYFSTFKNETA